MAIENIEGDRIPTTVTDPRNEGYLGTADKLKEKNPDSFVEKNDLEGNRYILSKPILGDITDTDGMFQTRMVIFSKGDIMRITGQQSLVQHIEISKFSPEIISNLKSFFIDRKNLSDARLDNNLNLVSASPGLRIEKMFDPRVSSSVIKSAVKQLKTESEIPVPLKGSYEDQQLRGKVQDLEKMLDI